MSGSQADMLTSRNSKYRSTDLSSAHPGVLQSNMYSLPFPLLLPKVKCAVRSIPSSHLSSAVSQYLVGVDLDKVCKNTSARAHKYASRQVCIFWNGQQACYSCHETMGAAQIHTTTRSPALLLAPSTLGCLRQSLATHHDPQRYRGNPSQPLLLIVLGDCFLLSGC